MARPTYAARAEAIRKNAEERLARDLGKLANRRLQAAVKEFRKKFPKRTLRIKFAGPFEYVTIDGLTVEFYEHDRYDHERWKAGYDEWVKVPTVRIESAKRPHHHRDTEVFDSPLYFLWRAVEDVRDITNRNSDAVADDVESKPEEVD